MFPPARASTPSPRRRWTASAVVVLFPLVPVMQATREGSASAMNRPRPPQTATPACSRRATSGRERLMPGLFTTTSQPRSASSPPPSVASTMVPSGASRGASSTRTGSRPMARSRRTLACPSTPSPQTPTEASASAAQEIGWRIAVGDAVEAMGLEEAGGVGDGGVAPLGAQPRDEVAVGPVVAPGHQRQGTAAFIGVADTLERLGAVTQGEQGAEALLVGLFLQRLPPVEDGLEVDPGHEGCQHQVHEAALVAASTPLVEAVGRVLVEGAVAAAEDRVVAGQPGKLRRHPQLAARA